VYDLIECYTGLPGEGKTYALAYRTYKALVQGKNVYTNFPCVGAYQLSIEDLQKAKFPANTLIVIDEAGYFFNSRDWKGFPRETYQLFSQHRKFKMDMILAVQSVSRLDKSIRELLNCVYWSKSFPPVGSRPLMFKYEKYFDPDDMGNDKYKGKSSVVLARKKYFKIFDTHEIIADFARQDIPQNRWHLYTDIKYLTFTGMIQYKIARFQQKVITDYRRYQNRRYMYKYGYCKF